MHFRTVAIIGRHQDTGLDAPLRRLAQALITAGCTVLVESDTSRNTGVTEFAIRSYQEIGEQADLAVVMGGDGTMLGAARELANSNVPLIGINHGRLGFITDIPVHNAIDALSSVLHGQYEAEDRVLLEGKVTRGDNVMFSGVALNDVVINRAGRGGMIELRIELNG